MKLAIIAITTNGARLGSRLKGGLPEADFFVARRFAGAAGKGATIFDGELRLLIKRLWPDYRGFVCIMATGIVVRLIAPLLKAKDRDPAVVVMDEAGRFAISLLSGHLGGANELAARCAKTVGGREVITTATDVNDLPSFDTLAKEQGWVIEDLRQVKRLNALLLEGKKIAVVDASNRVQATFAGRGQLAFFPTFVAALESGAEGLVFVTNRALPPQIRAERMLVLRPQNLVLGIGCNSGTSAEEIGVLVRLQLKRLFLSPLSVAAVASAEAKEQEAGLRTFAAEQEWPLRFYPSDELNGVATPSPPSPHALAAIGAIGVAEPAALLAAGPGSRLLLKKVKSGNVTLAIAEKAG
jgi:cobalt-precorrin 5A hydrolase